MLHALFSFSIFCRMYAIPTLWEWTGYFHAFGSLLTISFDIYYSSFIWLRFWNILVKKYFWVCHRKYYRNTICLYAYICKHTCEKTFSLKSKTKVDCDWDNITMLEWNRQCTYAVSSIMPQALPNNVSLHWSVHCGTLCPLPQVWILGIHVWAVAFFLLSSLFECLHLRPVLVSTLPYILVNIFYLSGVSPGQVSFMRSL